MPSPSNVLSNIKHRLHVCFLAVTSGPRLVTLTVEAALSSRGSIYTGDGGDDNTGGLCRVCRAEGDSDNGDLSWPLSSIQDTNMLAACVKLPHNNLQDSYLKLEFTESDLIN